MAWYLNRALTNLRAEVNARWPNRDKTSDGTIGDEAHQSTSSDHNPDSDGSVDAWDMDVDGVDVEFIKQQFERHAAAQYWIHNRKIASRNYGTQSNGRWKVKDYTGSNPHDKHVHFNTRSEYEDSTAPWGIKETPVTDAEMEELIDRLLARVVPSSSLGNKPFADWLKGGHLANRDLGIAVAAVKTDTSSILDGMQTPVPVEVDAAAVADALATNQAFLASLARAVNDDAAARLAS